MLCVQLRSSFLWRICEYEDPKWFTLLKTMRKGRWQKVDETEWTALLLKTAAGSTGLS
jgi:hypothetical protein